MYHLIPLGVKYALYIVSLIASGIYWIIRELRSRQAQQWPLAQGTVEWTQMRAPGFGDDKRELPEVSYSYSVHDDYYSGTHVCETEGDLVLFPKGLRITVHYDPSNPSSSFLDREEIRRFKAMPSLVAMK